MRSVTKITVLGTRLAIVVLVLYWVAIFVGTHLPGNVVAAIGVRVNDKVKHFVAFFLLGLLLCYVTNSSRWFLRFGTIGLIGMTYAAFDEWTQGFVPGRYPDMADFVANSLGLWSAIVLYMLVKWICVGFQQRPAQ